MRDETPCGCFIFDMSNCKMSAFQVAANTVTCSLWRADLAWHVRLSFRQPITTRYGVGSVLTRSLCVSTHSHRPHY